jgi:hypothetical protein
MARIKRHLLTRPGGLIGALGVMILFVLWAAMANPLERVESRSDTSTTRQTSVPQSTVPLQLNNNVAPALVGSESPSGLFILSPGIQAETDALVVRQPAMETVAVPDTAPLLDGPRQYALGMLETGNNDRAIGGAGEVSRFQLMPSVWKCYSNSRHYHDVDVALEVARQHWTALCNYFRTRTNREPTDFDMYVLWNTRQGYYASRGFDPARVNPVIRDRAQRFVNLVELGASREASAGNRGT